MKAKIIAFVAALLTIILTLTGHVVTAAAADGDDKPVIGLVTGTNPTGPTTKPGKQEGSDAEKIADEAGRVGAHVLLNTSTAGETRTTDYNDQVIGEGPNELIRKANLKKAQDNLVDAITASQGKAANRARVDVLSNIRHLADSLHALPRHPKTTQVVLWGSAWQNTPELQLTDPIKLADTKHTLDAVAQQGLLPNCAGWRVHMVGAAQTPDGPLDSQREVQLRELFRQLFDRCGGRLVEWSPDSLVSFPGSQTEIDQANWSKRHQVIVPLASGVLFDGDQDDLRPTAPKALDKVIELLTRTYPTATAKIDGYTASTPDGDPHIALKLSQARANSVSTYLQTHGINPTRLTATGHGAANPIATNDTEKGRQANRRVEIKINTTQ